MSNRPDDLDDEGLGARLESGLGTPPPQLTLRLERIAAIDLRTAVVQPRHVTGWLEFGPQYAGAALLLAILSGMTARLLAMAANSLHLVPLSPAAGPMPDASSAVTALMVPISVLLGVEALRGAPTLRRWLH